jgi:hypothetical protein
MVPGGENGEKGQPGENWKTATARAAIFPRMRVDA